MTKASGAGTRIAAVAATTFGTTPATPAFKTGRFNSSGLRPNKETATPDEIRADRQVTDLALLGFSVSGDLPFDLTYGGLHDDLLEAAFMGTWASNVLKNGTTSKSFTIEETLATGGDGSFRRYLGAMVDKLSLKFEAQKKITGTYSMLAQSMAFDNAIITGATYAASGTDPIMTTSAHIGSLSVGTWTDVKFRSFSLEIANDLRQRPYLGSVFSDELGAGMSKVTGSMEFYFERNDEYQAVVNHQTVGPISMTFGAAANKKYTITIPKVVLGDGEATVPGNTDDVIVTVPFQAILDTSLGAAISLTRNVA